MCLTKIINFYRLKLPILRKPYVLAMPNKKLRFNGLKCRLVLVYFVYIGS